MQVNNFAILIGINDQDEKGLKYCVKDVDDVEKTIIEYCHFKKENIFKIISEKGKENKNIKNELEKLINNGIKLTKGDLLLIYYSGHGSYDLKDNKSFFNFPETKYSTDNIKDILDKLEPKYAILLFDACYIGTGILSKKNIKKFKRKLLIDSEGTYGIYASPKEREAYQPPKLKNSLLTHYFLNIIRNESEYDESGSLTIDEIASKCAKKVYDYSVNLVKEKQISEEQLVVREGRIEGVLNFSHTLTNLNEMKSKSSDPKKAVTKSQKVEPTKEQEKVEERIEAVKTALTSFRKVVAAIVICKFFGVPYEPPHYYNSDIEEAMRKKIIDDEGEMYHHNKYVQSLTDSLNSLNNFILSEKRSDEFREYFYDTYDCTVEDYNSQEFWENVFDMNIPS